MTYENYYDILERAIEVTDGKEPTSYTSWRRQRTPVVYCKCGYTLALHRIDTKAVGLESTDCARFEPGEVRWKEVRWAHVPVE